MAANSSEKKEEDEAVEAAEDEDEEESLSLCDLPDNSNKEEDYQARIIKADSSHHHYQEAVVIEPPLQQEEFDFLLWGGPAFSKESEMCVADEVFFQGQILPLCCKSLSSDASRRLLPTTTGFNRSESSKSESVTSEFRSSSSSSSSSRSSSIRSQNSSSSISISSTITSITNPEISKPRIPNHHQFHTHPSPKPQLKASPNSSRQVSIGGHHLNRKSSTWDFFRLGVAPAPEIGLQDLKVRCTNNNKNKTTCVSRNSSNSSSSSDRRRMSNHGFRQMVRGCKCSVDTVPFDIMITKSNKKTESTTTHAMKEKAKQKQRKKAMSRHRTFEWIKELSHGYNKADEEEALLLNS
ncbi:hypothetical protein QN277_003300 [Acacia crassicarpa]|uniref:Uncharacterized protein n=1 Tax=Acacia crassicarpa TaxID=499986 RepID=A0AAE1JZ10_9FABA|nr:hypothetical protein QN277_003300 [Acacia crassicarpa]